MSYDSAADTMAHIERVRDRLGEMISGLQHRARVHDASKLESPEKEAFDRETPKLKSLTFGTPEYKASLEALGPALSHHYEHNNHHPEHYPDGVLDMDLLDLVEMVADWKAASERQKGGALRMESAFDRFGVGPELRSVLMNTVVRLGWLS